MIHDLVWKGRFIVKQDGYVDLPPDRQEVTGPTDTDDRQRFLEGLNDFLPANMMFDIIKSKLRSGEICTRERKDVVLIDATHEGDHWLVQGNTNASAGYFYVEARIVAEDSTPASDWHEIIETIETTLTDMSRDDRNDAIEALRSWFDEIYDRGSDDELNADERKAVDLIDGDERLASFAAVCGSDDLEERLTDEIDRNDLDIDVDHIDFVKVMDRFQNT